MVVEEFNAAVSQEKYPLAVGSVDSTTMDVFGGILDAARHESAEELQLRSTTQRFLILTLRHTHAVSELNELTPKSCFGELYTALVNAGASLSNLGDLVVQGDRAHATAHHLSSDPVAFFTLEDGAWKIALSRLEEVLDPEFQKAADGAGLSLDEALLAIIAYDHFHPPNPLILQGPLDYRLPTVARDGWAPDYPGPAIALEEPERFSRPSPKPKSLQPGQKVELLYRVLRDDESNPYNARREALWATIIGVRSGLYVGTLVEDSQLRSELKAGLEVMFFPGNILDVGETSSPSDA
jgi:hypothetical protein